MRIINEYPIYGSEAQKRVAEIYREYFLKNGWDCIVDEYSYKDIQSIDYVRKVWEYDPFYGDYPSKPKYNVYAVLDSHRPGKTFILNGHFDIDIIDKADLNRSYMKAKIVEDNRLLGRGSTDMLSGLNSLASIHNLLRGIGVEKSSSQLLLMKKLEEMVQSEHASIYLNMDTWMMYMSVLLQNLLIT